MHPRIGLLVRIVLTTLVAGAASLSGVSSATAEDVCPSGKLPAGSGKNIVLSKPCRVTGSASGNPQKYQYGTVNILKGGTLEFDDAIIELWAKSILIENGGALRAG